MIRKDVHNETEQKMMHDTLPNIFLKDVVGKFNKNFVAHQLSDKLIPLTLAGVPSVSKSFALWLLNLPVDGINVVSKFHKEISAIVTHFQ